MAAPALACTCLHLPAARCWFLIAERSGTGRPDHAYCPLRTSGQLLFGFFAFRFHCPFVPSARIGGTLGTCALAVIESSNTITGTEPSLTGPDHRLAPGPVTREAGIEKIREAAELAQHTGTTERPGAGGSSSGPGWPTGGGAAAQVTSQVPSRTGRQVTALGKPEGCGQESRSDANPQAELLKRQRRRLRCSPGKAPVSISISITSIFTPITARQLRQLDRSPSPLLITNSPLPPQAADSARAAVPRSVCRHQAILRGRQQKRQKDQDGRRTSKAKPPPAQKRWNQARAGAELWSTATRSSAAALGTAEAVSSRLTPDNWGERRSRNQSWLQAMG
ncbi:hypothetical protein BBK36DRAFT_165417 [Trichoderma citrinoviride]|uniref:Uncharacterized protein n=1 Tax=Trichoderma citrinoviride TaxID=58853 RepID=A0A2T4B749_9HYPO|nr:hypothetical protein BBK36DRAFT_165417 [Trichoderma citrinoviride]PTB65163.1 hypothetical protein BBK36DRAFT_165417 [Trichoderma citrinoviride]